MFPQAGSCLGLLMLLSVAVFRKPSYEFFLRTHQVLAFPQLFLVRMLSGGI